jgi:hypothetical protein
MASKRRGKYAGMPGLVPIAELGAALGAAAANAQKKKKKKKKTKPSGPSSTTTLSLGSASRVVRSREAGVLSMGGAYIPRGVSRSHIVRMPVDGSALVVNTTASAVYTVGGTYATLPLDINVGGAQCPFGVAIATIADYFVRWRICPGMRVFYEPVVPTNTAGAFAMAYIADGSAPTAGMSSAANVLACEGALVCPVWRPMELTLPNLETNWHYTHDPSSSSPAENRQDHAGALTIYGLSSAASTNYGYLRFTGFIELADYAISFTPATKPAVTPDPPHPPPPPALVPVPPSSLPSSLVGAPTTTKYQSSDGSTWLRVSEVNVD